MLVHLLRGELHRSDTWRTRLDTTTNWALTSSAAVISFTFASVRAPHTILIAGGFLVLTFLFLEARRYRYYDLWIRRVRLLEDGFVAPALREEEPDRDALRELADLIDRPNLTVSGLDAAALRMRRTYAPIFLLLVAAWVFKLYEHPTNATSIEMMVDRAHIGPLSGPVVVVLGALVVAGLIALYAYSFRRPLPRGELRARRMGRRPVADIFFWRKTGP